MLTLLDMTLDWINQLKETAASAAVNSIGVNPGHCLPDARLSATDGKSGASRERPAARRRQEIPVCSGLESNLTILLGLLPSARLGDRSRERFTAEATTIKSDSRNNLLI